MGCRRAVLAGHGGAREGGESDAGHVPGIERLRRTENSSLRASDGQFLMGASILFGRQGFLRVWCDGGRRSASRSNVLTSPKPRGPW